MALRRLIYITGLPCTLHNEHRDQCERNKVHDEAGNEIAPVSAQKGDDHGLFKVRLPNEEQCDGDAGLDREIDIAPGNLVVNVMPFHIPSVRPTMTSWGV